MAEPTNKELERYTLELERLRQKLGSGEISLDDYSEAIKAAGINCHVIGGADEAKELDAKRAINQAAFLASKI